MFKRNLTFDLQGPGGELVSRTLTPVKLFFSRNGDFVGMNVVDESNSLSQYVPVDQIVGVAEARGGDPLPLDVIAGFDLPAEETDDRRPVNIARRREFLRTRGSETWRTLGRQLGHIPSDAFRIVYSHGINQRRVKDVWFVSCNPGRDTVLVRDITNRRKQSIPVSMVLTVTDPRTGRTIEDEAAIRSFAQRFRPRSLLAMVRGTRQTPEIA